MKGPYSRMYWSVLTDAKFDHIRDDCRLFGAWSLLLLYADQAYPAPAFIPPTIAKSAVVRLAEARLIEVDGLRYRIRGLEKERQERSQTASDAAAKRWHSAGNAPASDSRMPSKAKQSKEETEQTPEHPEVIDDDGRADLEAYLLVTRRAPSPKQRKLLDDVLRLHDLSGPHWAAEIILRNPADPIGAVIEADKKWRSERIDKAKAVEAERKPVERRPRGLPQSTQEILNEMRQLDAARARGDAA